MNLNTCSRTTREERDAMKIVEETQMYFELSTLTFNFKHLCSWISSIKVFTHILILFRNFEVNVYVCTIKRFVTCVEKEMYYICKGSKYLKERSLS